MRGIVTGEAAARRNLYGLASRLLATEIDLPLYRRLTSPDVADRFATAGLTLVDPDVRRLGEQEAVGLLSVEFCRLFVGPYPASPPYASAWLEEVLQGGRAAGRLERFLARHGLAASRLEGLPILSVDHLSMELAILCSLHEAGAGGRAFGPDDHARRLAARELLDEHIVGWAVPYLHHLEAEARVSPYRSIARLTAALLAGEG